MNLAVVLLILILTGLITGVMIGLFGIGGGVVFVPALIFLLPYTEIHPGEIVHFSIATSLFAGAIASSTSAVRHLLNKNADIRKSSFLIYGTIAASLITPYFVVGFEPVVLHVLLAFLLILISIKFFIDGDTKLKTKIVKKSLSLLIPAGFIIGGISAASGIGGGIVICSVALHDLRTDS